MATKANAPAAGGSSLDRMPPIAKVGVGFLFAFLIGVLYFVVFYSDVDTDLTNARRAEKGLRTQLAEAEKSREDYQRDADEKTRREQQAREQKKILPDDPEMPAFLATIQDVATVSGVSLTSWSPTEQIPEEFYAKVPMKLTLVGKFHQLVKFSSGIGQQDRIINIEDIRIKKNKPDSEEVEVECRATAFRSTRPGELKKKR